MRYLRVRVKGVCPSIFFGCLFCCALLFSCSDFYPTTDMFAMPFPCNAFTRALHATLYLYGDVEHVYHTAEDHTRSPDFVSRLYMRLLCCYEDAACLSAQQHGHDDLSYLYAILRNIALMLHELSDHDLIKTQMPIAALCVSSKRVFAQRGLQLFECDDSGAYCN